MGKQFTSEYQPIRRRRPSWITKTKNEYDVTDKDINDIIKHYLILPIEDIREIIKTGIEKERKITAVETVLCKILLRGTGKEFDLLLDRLFGKRLDITSGGEKLPNIIINPDFLPDMEK